MTTTLPTPFCTNSLTDNTADAPATGSPCDGTAQQVTSM